MAAFRIEGIQVIDLTLNSWRVSLNNGAVWRTAVKLDTQLWQMLNQLQ